MSKQEPAAQEANGGRVVMSEAYLAVAVVILASDLEHTKRLEKDLLRAS